MRTVPCRNNVRTVPCRNNVESIIAVKRNKTFNDIENSRWKKEIEELANRNLLEGIDISENFYPEKTLKRGEFANIVSLLFKVGKQNDVETFTDVTKESIYYPYLENLKRFGLMKGYGKKFGGEDVLTREQMAVFISNAYRYANVEFTASDLHQFQSMHIKLYQSRLI